MKTFALCTIAICMFTDWVNGEGRSVAAHVRRVKWGAGKAIKPPFCYVPMTAREHQLQHQHGETYFNTPEWFEQQVLNYQQEYETQNV